MSWPKIERESIPIPLLRWFAAAATLNFPQAAGPVAFSLVALALTGSTSGGAALILVMTLAQVAGAVPITRAGAALPAARFLQGLILVRTLALLLIALLVSVSAPFFWLYVAAAFAGCVNGAAHGYLRSILNGLTHTSKLPRALGISATLNEVTFVLAPVAASGLGAISPIFAVVVIAILGAAPALLVPHVASAHLEDVPQADVGVLTPSIALWLFCAIAGGSAVAAIEIGAVALALSFDFAPVWAVLFTIPLCFASVSGGIWISVWNQTPSRRMVAAFLSIMTLGSGLVALQYSLSVTMIGTVMVGIALAPLGTYYSLALDELTPPRKRPEVFAMLRTANAVGVIFASAVLTATSLSAALLLVTGLMLVATITVAVRRDR